MNCRNDIHEIAAKLKVLRGMPRRSIPARAQATDWPAVLDVLEVELAKAPPLTPEHTDAMRRLENVYNLAGDAQARETAGRMLDETRMREVAAYTIVYPKIRVLKPDEAERIHREVEGILETSEAGTELRERVIAWLARNPKE